ncbi:hypothetical protein AFAEC_0458 [Aliarcobacter faecis]|uniref:RIO1 family regulatory kinase/ATPase domain-containing protein n=1 Tax=Aliarcobacter faecis TaxID=1564138 RepID=UPI00047BCB57|nr:RIO1 family regulatory kinase/ATPase [Aliarcobacter faecis]QKF72655.1 hypothetical protein AFAEC_0458 [Aliarcobacter faecis]
MSSFEELAKKEFESSNKEIFPFIFEEKQYWIKKARETKPNKIQTFFHKFFPFELLIPSLYKTSKEALEFESSKLKRFETLGINVPKVSYKNEDFFVLEDSGENINAILRNKNISEKKFYFYVDLVLQELAKIHNLGLFHGGSQIRNFTYKEEKVFVIDFEESFDKNIDIKTLQYRDFLLFILSFTKIKGVEFKVNYSYIIDKYLEVSNNKEFIINLKNFAKRFIFFVWLSKKEFIKKRLGSDVIYFLDLIEILNRMDKNAK